jgi:hypothetical protein
VPLSGGFVPVPNALFDEVLPTLRDTELRVLLIVVRQTLGWREGRTRYKRRDWLSRSQLTRRTGRASEAVSAAVDALVRRGLIVVEDTAGNPLATPEARRRHIGRLYYRLGDDGPAGTSGDMWKTGGPCQPVKANTTTAILCWDNIRIGCPPRESGARHETERPLPIRWRGWSRAGADDSR